jgi:hypothetical protein
MRTLAVSLGGELMQLHEQHAALLAERCVAAAGRIAQVAAGSVIAAFVREDAVEHEDFFAAGMLMAGKAGTGVVAHDARRVPALGILASQGFAPHARHRAGLPGRGGGINVRGFGEIHVEHRRLS